MANELTVSCSLTFTKSGNGDSKAYSGISIDVSGSKTTKIRQTIGTSEEALDIGDIGTCGFIIGKNLDATNYIEIRPGSGETDLVKVGPGEPFMFRLAMSGPYAIADTASCDIEFLIVED